MADFSDTRDTLTRRPKIAFVEPEQVPGEFQPEPEEVLTLDQRRAETQTIIKQYARLEKLSGIAQTRIDDRTKGFKVCLDPIQDATVLECLKRQFGTDEPCITYEQYKECVKTITAAGKKSASFITAEDMRVAAADPLRKDIGGSGSLPGLLRPELQVKSPVEAVDITKFKKQTLDELFRLLLPKLVGLNDFMISEAIKEALSKL